jgi:hypothetical protein
MHGMIPEFLHPITNEHGIGVDGTTDEIRRASWWRGRTFITLDGDFTAEELRAMADMIDPEGSAT